MTVRIRVTTEGEPDRFIAYHPTGALMLVKDAAYAATWPGWHEAGSVMRRCERTCQAPNEVQIEAAT